jgi:hypothetical protein
MANKFIHIGFNFVGPPDHDAIQKVLDKALDWVRYSDNCYIVWTSTEGSTWYRRFKRLLKPDEHVLIVGIDINDRYGWLPTWIWDWIDKDRN